MKKTELKEILQNEITRIKKFSILIHVKESIEKEISQTVKDLL